jgi:hypothetical protein
MSKLEEREKTKVQLEALYHQCLGQIALLKEMIKENEDKVTTS